MFVRRAVTRRAAVDQRGQSHNLSFADTFQRTDHPSAASSEFGVNTGKGRYLPVSLHAKNYSKPKIRKTNQHKFKHSKEVTS